MNRNRPFGYEGTSKEPEGISYEDLHRDEINRRNRPKPLNFDRRFGSPAFTPRKFARRGLIYRYPRTYIGVVVTSGLSIFFSKPIYDMFLRDYGPFTDEELKARETNSYCWWRHPVLYLERRIGRLDELKLQHVEGPPPKKEPTIIRPPKLW